MTVCPKLSRQSSCYIHTDEMIADKQDKNRLSVHSALGQANNPKDDHDHDHHCRHHDHHDHHDQINASAKMRLVDKGQQQCLV